MSLARIEIEEHRPGHWVAEVEAGYPACRRERVTGGDIVEIVTRVGEAYERLMGRPAFSAGPAIWAGPAEPQTVADVTKSADEQFFEGAEWSPAQLATISEQPRSVVSINRIAPIQARPTPEQVAQARRIGIRAKGSWSMTRYLREVAKVAGVEAPV
jgi:hypothetical protein